MICITKSKKLYTYAASDDHDVACSAQIINFALCLFGMYATVCI